GFGAGSILLGRLIDTKGAFVTLLLSTVLIAGGYALAALAPSLAVFALLQAVIGIGAGAAFIPLVADTSHWFAKRRALAMAICASGNYIGGALWPKITEVVARQYDWRTTYLVVATICFVGMLPACLVLRPRSPAHAGTTAVAPHSSRALGLSPNGLQLWLGIAGIGCCAAMAMPQVHIVAYCVDLGYGTTRGAEMLSIMTVFGIVSRLGSGWIADRIGGLKTLLLGSTAQAVALLGYLMSDGLAGLYVVSALFGLFQGGIVPSYAIIVREYFAPKEAGTRLGLVLMATLLGMALGGWMSGAIFDLTGSYSAAFLNGIVFNLLNVSIMVWLLRRSPRPPAIAAMA
ncbi:MAG TPA: MFS transporter, partial [Pseudolabrys sp.]|nr:MFS transporter [Pseudolabrys sp.]